MEKYEVIIDKGKISTSDISTSFSTWLTPVFLFVMGVFALYQLNYTSQPISTNETDFYQNSSHVLYNILFSLIAIFGIYLLFNSGKILKVIFCKDSKPVESKEKVIEKLMSDNKWKLVKKDINYYQFWENNIIAQSYYITIVFDEKGFYINSYPYLNRVIDFGKSKKRSNEISESIKGIHIKAN